MYQSFTIVSVAFEIGNIQRPRSFFPTFSSICAGGRAAPSVLSRREKLYLNGKKDGTDLLFATGYNYALHGFVAETRRRLESCVDRQWQLFPASFHPNWLHVERTACLSMHSSASSLFSFGFSHVTSCTTHEKVYVLCHSFRIFLRDTCNIF